VGKTAKFDRQQVVEKATNLYWEKGFHGTSMRNLQDVIDMRPGSIYAAFGSKDGLFQEALTSYTNNAAAHLLNCREATDTPLNALKLFVKQVVIESQSKDPSGMCMLTKTVAELTHEHEELLAHAKACFKRVESEFAKYICEAQQVGEVDADKDPQRLAQYIQIQISGLRTYAKANDGHVPLDQLIEDMFNHHPF